MVYCIPILLGSPATCWHIWIQSESYMGRVFFKRLTIYIFEVKLTFEILTVEVQQHSFSTHERVSLWKCQSFWDRKWLDLMGTLTPNLLIHDECSNLLSYQDQTFIVPCFEHWLWRYWYFWSNNARGYLDAFSFTMKSLEILDMPFVANLNIVTVFYIYG